MTLKQQVALAKKQMETAEKVNNNLKNKIGDSLPVYSILTSKNEIKTKSDIPINNALILALFNPGCDHCMKTAKLLYDNLFQLQNVSIMYVAANHLWKELSNFISDAKIEITNNNDFIVASDQSELINRLFESKGIPQIMIYDKNKILQKIFYNEVLIDSVTFYIKK